MNTSKQEIPESRQELLEKKRLSKAIRDWAGKNKKSFWKYEVSCFYKTYIIRVSNLPGPSVTDIQISSNNRVLNEIQKKQLCDIITKTCAQAKVFHDSIIDIQIDYDNGAVIAELI